MPSDENAGSSIYRKQIASLQQRSTPIYKPFSIPRRVTNENESLDDDTNDFNDNIERADICIETDIAIPINTEEVPRTFTNDILSVSCLKEMLNHYKELVSKVRDEVERKKQEVLDLENELQTNKSVRDEFFNELQNLLDEGGVDDFHDNVSSEVEHSRRPEDDRTDVE